MRDKRGIEQLHNDVICNLSMFVDNMAKLELPDGELEILMDMAYGFPDYQEAAEAEGWVRTDDNEFVNPETEDTSDTSSWEELCDMECIDTDDYRPETFEYWLVSWWLAEELAKRGERVTEDLMGIGPIWSRTTTGQSISIDEVIVEIYNKLLDDQQEVK